MGVHFGMSLTGLRAARTRVIAALQDGRIQFEAGEVRLGRNLLQTGDVSPDFVIRLLTRCKGDQYEESPHHYEPNTPCHVFKPLSAGVRWYVKCYFLARTPAEDAVFISVHIAGK